MENLKELVSIASKYKVKQIEVVGNHDSNNFSKFDLLYNGIVSGSIKSDEDAIKRLYPDVKQPRASYNRLKNRLKKRLINTLFFIDINQPQFTDIQKAFYNCNKHWIAIRFLISRGGSRTAIKLAERTIRVALKFEFTELVIYLAKELRFHFSVVRGDPTKYKYYNNLIKSHTNVLQAELLAEEYYTEVMLEYSQSQAALRTEAVDKAREYSKRLQTEYPNVQSFRFVRISYLLHVVYNQISFQFDKAIEYCRKAVRIFQDKPYQSNNAIFDFQLRLLSCCVQLMKYDLGESIAKRYMNSLPSGSFNWYTVLLYYFLLSTHSKNYQKCYDLLQTAITHPKFDNFYPQYKQLWYVYEAFVYFLIVSNKITANEGSSTQNFRLYKFLNDIPIYAKDKRGINIPILIIHVLLLLQQRKHGKILDRVDALNQYCHRYLRKDDTFRANCFIKMLLQMAKANFNRIRTERYAAKYRAKLTTMPLNVASQGIEVEIVPYEDLWEMVLELLD